MPIKILLPDDNEIRSIMEESYFHRDGFQFLTASAEEDIFPQIEEQDPDLVVLDVESTGFDAVELCSMVKKDSLLEKTGILLVVPSESRRRPDEYSCIDADAIVSRPIDHQRFLTSASQLLGIFDRANPRIETFLMVSCGADIDELHQGWIRNINAGGAFIETRDLLPVDYRMQVQFELDEGADLISCKGRVAWVNHPEWIKCERLPAGMGIQFLDLDAEDEKAINEFVESNLSQPGEA